MKTTLKASLLLALFGTTVVVIPAGAAKKDNAGKNNNTETTEVQETSLIPEICYDAIRKIKKGRVYDHHDCEMLLEEQTQKIQNLLTESRIISKEITWSDLGGCWPLSTIEPIEGLCTQLVDTHTNLGMEPASAWYMCKQGMIWQVEQIVVANGLGVECHSMRAVWASSWPNDYW
jgi:hypothetical protein